MNRCDRFNHRKETDAERFIGGLSQIAGRRLTWNQLMAASAVGGSARPRRGRKRFEAKKILKSLRDILGVRKSEVDEVSEKQGTETRQNVSVKPKRRVPRRSPVTKPKHSVTELGRFQCDSVRYDFEIAIDSFKTKEFSKTTGIKKGDYWSAVLPSDTHQSGYHVHFNGSIGEEKVRIKIEYWEGRVRRNASHPPPSSESIMEWIGSFIREPSWRAMIFGRFEKPDDAWKSRFNLPFKVTMADEEVVIDGVSLILPRNRFHAMDGWLTKSENVLIASVALFRPVEFGAFNLVDEVATLNDAVKMFVEQKT
jgi:hypothetical protein